jgi:hypothetical protein
MRRQGMFDSQAARKPPRMGAARPNTVKYSRPKANRYNSASRPDMQSNNSSRYINTDHKRNQINTSGNQAHILSYSLNKNVKGMKVSSKDKSKRSRPKTAGKVRAGGAPLRGNQMYNEPPQMQNNAYHYGQNPGQFPPE